jgi:hypothetical protein
LDPNALENIYFGLQKDDIQNLLTPSPFQLGQNTLLVIHEKGNFLEAIPPNPPSEMVHRNLEILRNIIFQQRILVDFNYYHLELPVNYPVVIFSEQPSFLTSEKLISIKYHPSPSHSPSPTHSPSLINSTPSTAATVAAAAAAPPLEEMMTAHKMWWSKCFEMNDHSIRTNPELIQRIEDDYVNSRQDTAVGQENSLRFLTNPDDLHNSLTLTRLYAVSCHSSEISLSHWEYVLYLEEARGMRV